MKKIIIALVIMLLSNNGQVLASSNVSQLAYGFEFGSEKSITVDGITYYEIWRGFTTVESKALRPDLTDDDIAYGSTRSSIYVTNPDKVYASSQQFNIQDGYPEKWTNSYVIFQVKNYGDEPNGYCKVNEDTGKVTVYKQDLGSDYSISVSSPNGINVTDKETPYEDFQVIKNRIYIPLITNTDVRSLIIDDFRAKTMDWKNYRIYSESYIIFPNDAGTGGDDNNKPKYDKDIPDFNGKLTLHKEKVGSTERLDGYELAWKPYESKYCLEVTFKYTYAYKENLFTNMLEYVKAENDPLVSASLSYYPLYGRKVSEYLKDNDPTFLRMQNDTNWEEDFSEWWNSIWDEKFDTDFYRYTFVPSEVRVRLATYESGNKMVGRWTVYRLNGDKIVSDLYDGMQDGTADDLGTGDIDIDEFPSDYPEDENGVKNPDDIVIDDTPSSTTDGDGNEKDHWTGNNVDTTLDSFFEFIKNVGNSLSNISSLFGKLFGFLPSSIIGLLFSGIAMAVICRFLGR